MTGRKKGSRKVIPITGRKKPAKVKTAMKPEKKLTVKECELKSVVTSLGKLYILVIKSEELAEAVAHNTIMAERLLRETTRKRKPSDAKQKKFTKFAHAQKVIMAKHKKNPEARAEALEKLEVKYADVELGIIEHNNEVARLSEEKEITLNMYPMKWSDFPSQVKPNNVGLLIDVID